MEKIFGEYPDEFLHHLDYISTDLDSVESLKRLPSYLEDNTYFLSVPPERYENAIINLKENRDSLKTQTSRVWLLRKPFGYDYKSADHLSTVVLDIYAKNRSIALTIILVKILLITFSLLGLATLYWNHFGIAST